tara:strand:- start:25277 stop:25936 length:660 start_codon:yes stop_codon:yes gene_type:complete
MHETLRTSFKLQKKDAEWQSITSDYAYGTFFNLYAKFEFKEDSFNPISCSIKIQNFQGNVTIGLSEIDENIKIYYDKSLQEYVFLIRIHLKALTAKTELTSNISFDGSTNHYHTDNMVTQTQFTNKNLLFVELIYDKLYTDEQLEDVNKLKYIDGLRHLRDGDQLLVKELSIYGNKENVIHDADSTNPRSSKNVDLNGNEKDYKYVESRPCRNTYVRFI